MSERDAHSFDGSGGRHRIEAAALSASALRSRADGSGAAIRSQAGRDVHRRRSCRRVSHRARSHWRRRDFAFRGRGSEAPWETILSSNIVGTYNLFEAARKQKVRRVVFASTNHVVGFYPRSQTIGPQVLPLPDFRAMASARHLARRSDPLLAQIWAERFLYPHRQRVGLPRRRAATRHMA